MKPGSIRSFSKGEFKGWMAEELLDVVLSGFFEDPVSFARREGGQILKDGRWRVAAIFPLTQGRKIFLKRDRTKNWVEFLKYLFLPTRARKEWFIAHQAQKRHLNVPKPLGWMERGRWGFVAESYYLSEAMGSGFSLIDSVRSGMRFPLEELAKTVKKIHNVGLFHRDLHGGNFLWDGQSFFLTDLHRARILKRLSLKRKLWNLSHLFHSLRDTWEEKDQERFMDLYLKGDPVSPHEKRVFLQQIRCGMEKPNESVPEREHGVHH
jgi:tRNA A-37 threonylcarbamoyl transferase component Bud32